MFGIFLLRGVHLFTSLLTVFKKVSIVITGGGGANATKHVGKLKYCCSSLEEKKKKKTGLFTQVPKKGDIRG